jgi:hypothetical protein
MSPKVVITFGENKGGDMTITGKFIPALKKGQRLSKAQSFALDVMAAIGGEAGQSVSAAIKSGRSKERKRQ